MHTVEKCFGLDSNIINLEVLDNKYVAISTESGEVRINSCDNYDNKLIITSKNLTSDVTAMSFSPNVALLAFAVKNTIYVIDTRFDETINEIKMDANEVDMLKFDPTSEYLIVGTKFGRVYQYKSNNSSVLSRLCSFPYDRSNLPKNFINYVSAITFNELKIACSGYGGAIFIMDLHINTYRDVITHSQARTDALCFIDREVLIAGNSDGEILVISMKGCIEYEAVQTPFKNIKHIIHIPNTTYVFITLEENYLAIVDYESKKVVNECYAKFHDTIVNISLLDDKNVVIALRNSEILKLNLPTPEQLDEIITRYPLAKILKITQNSTIVQNYKNYKKLEKDYEEIYKKATKALIDDDKRSAILLLRDFKDIKSKQKGIRDLLISFENYNKLKVYIRDRRYIDAYNLCEKYTMLMETDEYKNMENRWQKSFLSAQRELIVGHFDNARKLLILYKDIPSKAQMCSFIFKHYIDFLTFLKALDKKDFKTIDKISHKHEEFKKLPVYINLKNKIDGSIKLVENCLLKSNVTLAKKHLDKLRNIPHIHNYFRELELKSYNIIQLQEAYERKDLKACYRLIDTKKFLHHIALGRALERHWAKVVEKCEEHALEGRVEKVKETLGDLINIESRKSKLGDLLRVGYHTRIKKYIQTNNTTFAVHVIETYLNIFGIDHEIEDIIKMFEEAFCEKIPYEDHGYKRGHRDNWRISINDI